MLPGMQAEGLESRRLGCGHDELGCGTGPGEMRPPVCHKSILIVSRPAESSATPRKMRRGRSLFRNKSIAADTSHSMLIAIFAEHSTRSGHRTIISQSNARELLLLRFDGRS
jgi:hypothetical protein